MKQLLTILILCIVKLGIFAQNVTVKGVVYDAKSQKPHELANIVLQTKDSLFLQGTTSSKGGNFTFEKVVSGDYRIIISSIGYFTQVIELPELVTSRSLGDILLEEDVIALQEVAISSSNTYSDRKLIFPSIRQIEASTNGVNILQQLMLPKVQVNALTDEVTLLGRGVLQFRINGVEATLNEIKALPLSEIIRIEYYDNPGLRYDNVDVVLNYVVHRPDTGGNIHVELSDAFNFPVWGGNGVWAKGNHKKSEWALFYGIQHRYFKKVYRDNEERFTFMDGSVLNRLEVGEPGSLKMQTHDFSTAYSFMEPDKRMIKATFIFHSDNPHWKYNGYLYNQANLNDQAYMIDETHDKNWRPSIDFYYQENLNNQQTLVFNIVGTYNKTRNNRFYQENKNENILIDINNRVKGSRYSVISEGIYEKKFGVSTISGGIRYTKSNTENSYLEIESEMNQTLTSTFGEFRGKLKNLNYTLGIGITHSKLKQKGNESYENYTVNPRFTLHYNLRGNSFIRLNGGMNNSNPSLSNLSAVEQPIDSLQIQRGNPNLKPYNKFLLELTYEFQKGIVYTNISANYEYQRKAIMDEKYWEEDKIIQTWNNQKNWQHVSGKAMLRVGPIKDILQLSATGGVNHYISNGHTYSHTYTNWYTNINMAATYKKFMLAFDLFTNWNFFYGETLSGGENVHTLMLQYSFKNTAVTIGALNLFVDNYKTESENWSQYASFQKKHYIGESSRLFIAKFIYNFSFGRMFNAGQKKLNNQDAESGVMNTGK